MTGFLRTTEASRCCLIDLLLEEEDSDFEGFCHSPAGGSSTAKLMSSTSDAVAENRTVHHNPSSYLRVFWRLEGTGTPVAVAGLGMHLG